MKHPTVTQPEWEKEFDENFVFHESYKKDIFNKPIVKNTLWDWEKDSPLIDADKIKSFIKKLIQSVADESARMEREKFIKNEIKILKQKIKDLPELIGGIDSENYELWTMVLKYYQSSLKEDL